MRASLFKATALDRQGTPYSRRSVAGRLHVACSLLAVGVGMIGLAGPRGASAVEVVLQSSDPLGTSSFDSGARWSPGINPSTDGAGNDYRTSNNRLRTPDNAGSATFGGDSLTVEAGGSLSLKAANNGTVTVDDLTIADGGNVVVYTANRTMTLQGNGITLTGVAEFDGRQSGRNLVIASPISGLGGVSVITSGGGTGDVTFTSGNNTYTGGTSITPSGRLSLGADNSFSAASLMTVNGTLRMSAFDGSVAGLAGTGTVVNGGSGPSTLSIVGSSNNTFGGTLSNGGSGTLALSKSGSGTQTINGNINIGGGIGVSGGTLTLSGNNTFGNVSVNGGALNVRGSGALGGSSGTTDVRGSGRVDLTGNNLNVNEVFNLFGRDDLGVHLSNLANADSINTISGPVNLVGGDGPNYNIESRSGTLRLTGGVVQALTAGDRVLNLSGAGEGNLEGLEMAAGAANSLVKSGSGIWTVNDARIGSPATIRSESGVLNLAGEITILDDAIFDILADAELDVDNVDGGFVITSGQGIVGEGRVDGNVIAESGAMIAPGPEDVDNSVGTLTFDDTLTLASGILEIDIFGSTSVDVLAVDGEFIIDNGRLNLNTRSLSTQLGTAYIFATYGRLSGEFQDADVSGLPSNYTIDYNYNELNRIALVNIGSGEPLPVPAPLALIAIGLFAFANVRRQQQRHAGG